MTDEGWRESALCAQVDSELWFPKKGQSTRPARRVCAACPVQAECLRYALDTDQRFGIWGGVTERQRSRMKRLGASQGKAVA